MSDLFTPEFVRECTEIFQSLWTALTVIRSALRPPATRPAAVETDALVVGVKSLRPVSGDPGAVVAVRVAVNVDIRHAA